ncbi:Holliday junction branch migration protein RuvA [Virgibacillus alimentarius]|uniref:Holliday junction branch migration complex subunit RuvA n=1 Tax=Virgibacillus alimentarius TaxID=698769 RepID=A0ABS4S545_9BACI|nr:Holliday junction branch migration protein RuvA [Virgibacillus alimentarius]MBP2256622.1 Holliday junction DNA helicase RuvA [Virgibacillus alimentarius]
MIAFIKGNLTYILEESIIVDVHGVGYEIFCADPFMFQSSINQEMKIYTYHHVRDDAQVLYGFKNEDEKYLFTRLISVSGIGPKGALAIQGSVDVESFVSAVEREDEKFLTKFPGVGKKTARQIILDLKGKLTSMISIAHESESKVDTNQENADSLKEAQEALKALGYTEKEIKAVLPKLPKDQNVSTDELIRKALNLFMKN